MPNVSFEVSVSKNHGIQLKSRALTCKPKENTSSSENSTEFYYCKEVKQYLLDNSDHKYSDKFVADLPWDFSLLKNHLQSPVDIITANADYLNLKPLKFTAVNDESVVSVIKNSGHGVSVQIESDPSIGSAAKPKLTGSFLQDTYVFENIHYHWGKQDYFGSEHFINGECFGLEAHMVTFKKSYGDINEALKYKDGVVVFTFFAKEGEKNKKFDKFLQYIPQIVEGESIVKVKKLDVILWFLPELIEENRYSDYYAYPGSLTTPPFSESVTFIIVPEPLTVSHEQLDVLRHLKNEETKAVKTNRRELQPLRGRPLICANNIKWSIKVSRSRRSLLSNVKNIKYF